MQTSIVYISHRRFARPSTNSGKGRWPDHSPWIRTFGFHIHHPTLEWRLPMKAFAWCHRTYSLVRFDVPIITIPTRCMHEYFRSMPSCIPEFQIGGPSPACDWRSVSSCYRRDCLLGLAIITYEYINLRPIHLFVSRLARRHHIESLRNLACSTLSMPAFFTCFPGSLLLQSWRQSTRSCAVFRLSANYTNLTARAPRADLTFHW